MDGWTASCRHYVALFAVYWDSTCGADADERRCKSRRYILHAFCPLDDESDMGSQAHYDFIADPLSVYECPWSRVSFLVGDNCSTNQCIGRKEGALPLIGCASHRFNLAVRAFLEAHETMVEKVHKFMKKLATVKGRAVLKKISKLHPKLNNVTRWSSTYEMLERFVALHPHVKMLEFKDLEKIRIVDLLFIPHEFAQAEELLAQLANLEEATRELQKEELTLAAARDLFDLAIKRYPCMKKDLSTTSSHVVTPQLETGLKNASYVDVSYIPPTSNVCERFFSSAKLVYSDLRKKMDYETLEDVMMLKYNDALWNAYTVQSICARHPATCSTVD
ncbi:hypothetical protein PHYSODRAFT_475146 [Phytophthora sojae]|uniref:HAT C-terminal dimerisation domain-containing protein n=1 Tax=Phytophthora sojae (strain P6497) TaxID=1094619 RepID=G4YNX7_PHYSP|nr:hypothetical protein PHYSODRAFT_475146 [Phytophthora sojae]EGZ30684.1 hypothetical protein PHYSODRAFT_475146 [Phytophthora sojae]|eukprot:XP_009517959.1 hypothetical protein PHYSODRAFT_475146 [Phytophthora sojae]